GIRDFHVTGVQTCALPICAGGELVETVGELARAVGGLPGAVREGPHAAGELPGAIGGLGGAVGELARAGGEVLRTVVELGGAAELGRASCRESARDRGAGI